MIERLEGTFWGYQDAELYYQVWKPQTSVGIMVVTHGLAEHSDCYQKFAEDIARAGWTVFTWDLRGHGRSEGKRGYVARFLDFCEDLDKAVRFLKMQNFGPSDNIVLFGHSMGGLITLRAQDTHSIAGVQCIALSAPACGIALEVPKLKKSAAYLLADWAPKLTMHNEIDFRVLSRDEKVVRSYKSDPLRHDKASPRLFVDMMEEFEVIKKIAPELRLPTIMQLAGKDKVVSTPAAEAVFDLLGSKRKSIFVYAESYHEIFNDYDRDQAIKDLLEFIK